MNGTPIRRGPGGFPTTPQQGGKSIDASSPNAPTPSRPNVQTTLPDAPKSTEQAKTGPWIPRDVLDDAQQRFYIFAIYIALWAWRSYDFYTLAVDQEESLASCLKWCFLDMLFMFGVPLLEIQWLEWSNATAFLLFALHAGIDVMLMFRIGLPIQTWLLSVLAFMWDKESAIGERHVKPGTILQNASLILGKQIVNILPEGSAILNPNRDSFCLNSTVTHLEIPILINQTDPVEIELLRIDIGTNNNESIIIKKGELKGLLKRARKGIRNSDPADPVTLRYTVKKTGVYLLKRVLDQSKLEVRPRLSNAVIATCPQARVVPTGNDRCRNDVSNVELEVEGIPPLTIKYRLTVNGQSRGASEFQSLQPEEYTSPLSKQSSQALILSNREDVSWAKPQKVVVGLKETLTTSGVWKYAVEEVQDGLGNFVSYTALDEDDQPRYKHPGIQQSFIVHERPSVILDGCNHQVPLQIAKGTVGKLPLKYGSTGADRSAINSQHIVEYLFTPEADLLSSGDHAPSADLKKQTMRTIREQPLISGAGLYTVKSIATDFCAGEVLEPASCLLRNPPEPELSLESEHIVDKCAGNPIGMRVSLDLTGTPPFTIKYTEQRNRERAQHKTIKIDSLRRTFDLTPDDAGQYTYVFESIKDWVYPERPLENKKLSQNVKPSASAHFTDAYDTKHACIDGKVDYNVRLWGEGPWTLDYELIHNGKREKKSVAIEDQQYTISTPELKSGGEYTISLTSVTDKMNCKEYLKEEAKVNVRHERPKAYFGLIEGKQDVMALEGKKVNIPLRLTGTGPWKLEYENIETKEVTKTTVRNANDQLETNSQGTYHLLSVDDSVCPGFVDEKASRFSVSWIPRPTISIPESASMILHGNTYVKEAVCEGEEDSFDVQFSGNAPYDVEYEQLFKDKTNGKTAALSKKDLRAPGATTSIRADTSHAGVYEYRFKHLADSKYDHSSKHFTPAVVQQTVYSLPNARFDKPGKVYSFCTREAEGEEVIPMTFEGVPPFYLEIEIKHQGTPKPELSVHKNIPSNKYDIRIEHRKLHLGHSSVTIRKVRDSRGCSRKPAQSSPRVQLSVHDAPTATPLEDRTDFCVGERLSFALGGQVPFTVYYTFEKQERKASNAGTTFRRLAELPGTFTITGLRDSASECLASLDLTKHIHPIPSVRLSGGQVSSVDIHEGGVSDLEFQFWGTPPFEFTYTRSTNAVRGKKSKVLEIRTEVSHEHQMKIPVQDEGTYEVVSIKDRWCSFARPGEGTGDRGKGQKLLQY
ncbi:hypothetical protein B0J11DRAFT_450396 [Dendryphion nanum]|uniref:Nucleoporin Pom152 n=1 Tax=Dendryphion nanum TaxID=256645 RepID=A0A9P9EHE9_9PLEO|nr:hypothetical protein B0J11DRAFT_450396 [Dendryphion nanum]